MPTNTQKALHTMDEMKFPWGGGHEQAWQIDNSQKTA